MSFTRRNDNRRRRDISRNVPMDVLNATMNPIDTVVQGPLNQLIAPVETDEDLQKRLDLEDRLRQNVDAMQEIVVLESFINTLSFGDMETIAACSVHTENKEGPNSIYDSRMGDRFGECATCHLVNCGGHPGLIRLNNPVLNPAFSSDIVRVLTCVCSNCGSMMFPKRFIPKDGELIMDPDTNQPIAVPSFAAIPYDRRVKMLRNLLRNEGFLRYTGIERLRQIARYLKTDSVCINAHEHEDKNFNMSPAIAPCIVTQDKNMLQQQMNAITCPGNPNYLASITNKFGKIAYGKTNDYEFLPICKVDQILSSIRDPDAKLLGFDTGLTHPRNFIVRGLLVVPPMYRPPPTYNGKLAEYSEDDYSRFYLTMVGINNKMGMLRQSRVRIDMDNFDRLNTLLFTKYRDFLLSSKPDVTSIKNIVSGKHGLMRKHLAGKRVNYSARTVLGSDPDIKYGQIRIPELMAPTLTKRVKVNRFNQHTITQLISAGKVTHIEKPKLGRVKIKPGKTYTPEIGDIVDRWLQNGDRVLINRQPSVHKYSMQSFEVVLGKQLTVGMHLSNTRQFNADFDGDEVNVHVVQTIEGGVEVEEIMATEKCIMGQKGNIAGLVLDNVSGAFMLTSDKVTIQDDLFMEAMTILSDTSNIASLGDRLRRHGVHPRSGKAYFSMLLPEDFNYRRIDADAPEKSVIIENGVLKQGRITSAHVSGGHNTIISKLWNQYGVDAAVNFLSDAPHLITHWLNFAGLSIGLSDCMRMKKVVRHRVNPETQELESYTEEVDLNEEMTRKFVADVRAKIEALGPRPLNPDDARVYDGEVKSILKGTSALAAEMMNSVDPDTNAVSIMSKTGSGAKGDTFNIAQISLLIGQQNFQGGRIPVKGMPAFDPTDTSIEAQGFITTSFMKGLNPVQLFQLMYAGRAPTASTSIDVPLVGHINRMLQTFLRDLVVGPRGEVRDATNRVIQYTYGYDTVASTVVSTPGYKNIPSFIDLKYEVLNLNIAHSQ